MNVPELYDALNYVDASRQKRMEISTLGLNHPKNHLTQITTTCFDWLIGNQKVAAKAYSMTSLLMLGSKFDWIWPELRLILEQNYHNGSPAYQARARMTLAKLN